MNLFARSIVFLVTSVSIEGAFAGPCAEASYNLTEQEEVDALGATGCDVITGDLSVDKSADVYNLEPLVALTRVEGAIKISGNTALLNLDGLLNISRAGSVEISENTIMTNVDGLIGLLEVGALKISTNAVLRDLEGLGELASVTGDLTIESNPLIVNLDGLRGLIRVGGTLTIEDNNALQDLDGLSKLTQIGTALTIKDNPALTTIRGLSGLNAISEVVASASALEGGSISPASQQVLPGLSAQFTVTADDGYSFSAMTGTCPAGSFDGSTYTTGPLTEDCTVVANFTNIASFTVTASALTGGSISPLFRTVEEGGFATFTVTPDADYSFSAIGGTCPSGTLTGSSYATGVITEDCTVIATFSSNSGSDYCAGAPAGVICDPNADGRLNPGGNMDSWVGLTWGFENTPIPNGKTVAYPFTANAGAAGGEGIMTFSNNMPDLTSSHYYWKGWFSETPGGAVLNNNAPYCRRFSPNPNPQEIRWTQSADPNRFACNLGQAERVLYFNMEVACYEELPSNVPEDEKNCTVGAPFPGISGFDEYYIKVYPR